MENSVDHDQLAQKPTEMDLQCFQKRINMDSAWQAVKNLDAFVLEHVRVLKYNHDNALNSIEHLGLLL